MNSNVKIRQTRRNFMCAESKLVINWLNLNLSLAGLCWPLYVGGLVSRIRGSIQITMYMISTRIFTMSTFEPNSYYTITRTDPRGTKIMGFSSYTLVSRPRDSTRIVDSG
jgi:hypothetical protein